MDELDKELKQMGWTREFVEEERARIAKMGMSTYLNIQDNEGKTALMYAVGNGDSWAHLIIDMLKKGADPRIKDNQGKTALDYAKGHKKLEAILKMWE